MKNKLFNITDAHNAMTNLTSEMAEMWVKVANKEYERLKKLKGSEPLCQKRSIQRANKEIIARYGGKHEVIE